jgi:hypothetical protein
MALALGIDPGVKGAIAWATPRGIGVRSMPDTEGGITVFLRELCQLDEPSRFCAIELQTPRPTIWKRNGVTQRSILASTVKLVANFSYIKGCLSSLDIPFEEVSPVVWQRRLGSLTGGDKRVSKRRAEKLFPEMGTIAKDRADALLLLEWCLREKGWERGPSVCSSSPEGQGKD